MTNTNTQMVPRHTPPLNHSTRAKLANPCPELRPNSRRHSNTPDSIIMLRAPRIDIRLRGLYKSRSVHNFMTHVQHHKQNKANIRCEKAGRIPRNEAHEAICDDNQDIKEQSIPCEERLPHSLIREGIARDVANGQGTHESEVASIDARPGDEPRDSSDAEEPIEDGTAVAGEVEEGEEAESSSEGDGGVGDASLGCAFEEGGGKAGVRETDEDAGTGIDV